MLRRSRSRLTYANIMATIAVFIALGGVSYAAVTLPKNSVGRAQIKRNAVTGLKVNGSSLAGSDIRNSSLTGSDVKDGSLTAKDFNGSVQGAKGPSGAQGPKGDSGADGAPGPSDAYVSHVAGGVDSSTTDADVTSVNVPAGNYVVTAKLYAVRPVGTSDLLCSLMNGTDQLDFTHAGNNMDTNEPYVKLPLEGFATVSSPATLRLSCTGNGTVTRMYGITLVALKVGTLHS